jgi:hypothetical protein
MEKKKINEITNKIEWIIHQPSYKKHKGVKKITAIKNLNIVTLYKTERNRFQTHES